MTNLSHLLFLKRLEIAQKNNKQNVDCGMKKKKKTKSNI
jgi:hypothetical protein